MTTAQPRSAAALALIAIAILAGCTSQPDWQPLFDGQTLDGWHELPNPELDSWRVEDGMVVAGDGETRIPANTFLCTQRDFDNFEFRCRFMITGDADTGMINGGIQYRSYFANGRVTGYQADIGGPSWWGAIYDEHRRNRILVDNDIDALRPHLNTDGWNDYLIRCVGDHHQLYINGILVSDYTEPDASIPTTGFFGLQLHSGGNAVIRFRDVEVREIEPE